MVSNSEKAAYLTILQQEVDKLINESKSHHEKTNRYEALRNIIDLISQEEEFNLRFDEFSDMIISMAQMNFAQKIDIGSGDDLFSYIATSLNLLSEELDHRAAPRHFLEESLQLISDAVIFTNDEGKICYFNTLFSTLTGYSKEEITNAGISLILPAISFNPEEFPAESVIQELNLLNKKQEEIPVTVTIKPIKGPNDTANGILLLLKR